MQEKDSLAYLEENERLASQAAKDALTARDDAQKLLDQANAAYQAWRVLAAQERERRGVDLQPTATVGAAIESIGEYAEEQRQNRTGYVRIILKIAGARGVTPASILAISRIDNPRIIAPNFPYGQLSKLKTSGEVVVLTVNGEDRYALKEFLENDPAMPR